MQSESETNILLVDDYPENLLALEAMLENLGANLVKAHSGEEALRCLLSQDFAVILLDVQMPGMDGFETATLIRSRERSRHTPIIFLTAFSTSDNLVFKGYSLGAVDYLFKPIEPDILISKVTVFVDLFNKTDEVRQQAEKLKQQATKLKAFNQQLRQSEERFRSLSACSPVGIFVADIDQGCTYTNPRCQSICGFTLEESLGDGWIDFLYKEDQERAVNDWFTYIHGGHRYEFSGEYRFQTKDGTIRWTTMRASPMLSDRGELLGHVGTVEDITERKQAEEARNQVIREQAARQQAESANRMKDEFLAILSHELRTPLNSMLGWSKLLRTRKFDEETTTRALEAIERNAQSQARLIEDILDVSQIIRGKLRLNCCPISLVSVVEAAIELVRPLADAKTIELRCTVVPSARDRNDATSQVEASDLSSSHKTPNAQRQDATFQVMGDMHRLQQVVSNLLTNAIKFTPEQGSVEVRLSLDRAPLSTEAPETTTNLRPSTAYARIQVIDTGIGISPDFLPHVFERFRQADSTTTRSHGGLGLGLAIVRHLVELSGGSVQAESAGDGQGATFTVRLPLLQAGHASELLPPSAALEEPSIEDRMAGQIEESLAYSTNLVSNDGATPKHSDVEATSANSLNGAAGTVPSGEKTVASTAPPSLRNIKILVVDDEIDTRNLLVFALEQHEAEVIAVGSAEEAIAALQTAEPHVIVSDIGMPEEDGYSLIRKIRSQEPWQGSRVPAIALTAYSREEDRLQALAAGFQAYMVKPVIPIELAKTVTELLAVASPID